jgi:hypothetical protein
MSQTSESIYLNIYIYILSQGLGAVALGCSAGKNKGPPSSGGDGGSPARIDSKG